MFSTALGICLGMGTLGYIVHYLIKQTNKHMA